jgi:hypothetical protein
MQVWLQEFAWTEEEKQEKSQKRAADGEVGELLAKEPLFCFGEGRLEFLPREFMVQT